MDTRWQTPRVQPHLVLSASGKLFSPGTERSKRDTAADHKHIFESEKEKDKERQVDERHCSKKQG